ncbi:hypothetical protein DPMN_021342 [Dreissena polymorpha]|uniref:Uncharacterized protein n=1 Tax=Dreissena polymorpha TaxID=45954 RepID=A0A9D4NID7_DREPO|nr:hypothetical protein DPMN_021342 [Dreissena polymorpha]
MFHEDWTKQMKTSPNPGVHVFERTTIISKFCQDILGANISCKVNYRHTLKTALPLDRYFNTPEPISKKKFLTKFHEDWTKNNTFRVLTRKTRDKIVTKPGKNVTSRVLARKIAPPGRPYKDNINVFTKFHDDWAKNVSSRVFTSFFCYINIRKKRPHPWQPCFSMHRKHWPTGGHVFSPIRSIFELVLTKFHDDRAKNPRENAPPPLAAMFFNGPFSNSSLVSRKHWPTGGHVFSPIRSIFELV